MGIQEAWFVVIAVLFLGYFVLEGFDFGVGMLFPVLGRTDTRRRVLLNTIGPVWDGNEVWLITAGGALFAAFPEWYATMFAGFYLPLLLILVALILRVCAIEWRGKIDDPTWRRRCDLGIMIGSWVPAIVWGVAFANLVRGVAIDADKQMTSSLFDLFGPYALLGGMTFALAFALHGAVFIALKTSGEVHTDAMKVAQRLALPTLVVIGVFVIWTQTAYGKTWTWALVAAVLAALLGVIATIRANREGWAFAFNAIVILGFIGLLFASLFPNVMPSTTAAEYGLTIYNASSSPYTLKVMSWAAAFSAPVVLLYQGWTYWVFRQRISTEQIPPSIGLKLGSGK